MCKYLPIIEAITIIITKILMNMKKIILSVVISMIAYNFALGATLQRAILSHNGNLTQYDNNNWQKAISDAVAGDTIYFTSGKFDSSSDVILNKPLTLIGPGVSMADCFNSKVYGDYYTSGESATIGRLTISIAESDTLYACCFEGIVFSSNIEPSSSLSKMTIRRCHIEGGLYPLSSNNMVKDLTLESCYIGSLYGDRLVNPDIHNCFIKTVFKADGFTFTNCTIQGVNTASSLNNCYFVNCILNTSGHYCTYVNCVHYGGYDDSTYTNCWTVSNPLTLTAEQILAAGYLGVDGSIVGPIGGPAPFTMKPSQPYIEDGNVEYDAANKVLNVSMKVKRGE